ncbi:MFS transporter [Paenibacillus daejeonensis]|uniref:MFS transporter n=1 Tax=Paenibacillus daejeonensis TaxID=135193 RepID=UPI000361CA41|nr:MFS transporter [Paenibacillus daejeonensis]
MDTNITSLSTESLQKAGIREWAGLAVLALPTLLLALDMSVLYLATPHLSEELEPSSVQLLWIMDIYSFMIAGFLVTMGTLGDRIGRRKLLMIGGAAFGITSVVAAVSTSAEMLIAARALLGISGATLMPSTLALISNMFKDPKQKGVALGVWMSCFSGGAAIGPLVGGVLLEFFHWGTVFLIGVPIMILLLLTAPRLLPEYKAPGAGPIELLSVSLSLLTILPVVYGLKELAKYGMTVTSIAALAGGIIFGIVFVKRQRQLATPLIDFQLFKNRTLSVSLGIMLLGAAAMGGIGLIISQYLQLVAGLSPLQAGLWSVLAMVAVTISSIAAPILSRRISPSYIMSSGLACAAIGCILLARVGDTTDFALLISGHILMVFGIGPIGVLVTELVVDSAPRERAGSASALSEMSGELGVALGVAILGSIGTTVYQKMMRDSIPSGLPTEVTEAIIDTITGLTAIAKQLPVELASMLQLSAGEAFTSSLNIVAIITAITFFMLSVLTLFKIRISK